MMDSDLRQPYPRHLSLRMWTGWVQVAGLQQWEQSPGAWYRGTHPSLHSLVITPSTFGTGELKVLTPACP